MKRIKFAGDYLDLEREHTYLCSDGCIVHTLSLEKLLKAQLESCQKEHEAVIREILGEIEKYWHLGGWDSDRLEALKQKYVSGA